MAQTLLSYVVTFLRGPTMMPSVTTATLDQLAPSTGNADLRGGPNSANQMPQPMALSFSQFLHGLNPVQHLPVIGTIYRAVTGDTIPAPMQVAGAGIFGGPMGMMGAALFGMLREVMTMPADTSRPAAPAGMAATGSEQGMQPVSPGELAPGAYTSLATTQPEWLGTRNFGTSPADFANDATRIAAAQEYQRAAWVEKGLA